MALPAGAFCRSTTCPREQCNPELLVCWQDFGQPLYWPGRTVSVVAASGSELRGISAAVAAGVFEQALLTWTSVDCGGAPPSIAVGSVDVDETVPPLAHTPEVEQDAGEGLDGVNALYFIDRDWPHGVADIALATTSFRISSGRILESDIEVNSERNEITIGDAAPVVDLLSVLTHESGHFFGLAHVYDRGPTMYVGYTGDGDLGPRSLEPDDVAGMCAIYPADRFESLERGGCSCGVLGATRAPGALWLFIGVGAAWLGRRRRLRLPSAP